MRYHDLLGRSDDGGSWVRRYTSSTDVTTGLCGGRAVTVQVLIQPFGEDFDIETSGLVLTNVSAYTARFGRGQRYQTRRVLFPFWLWPKRWQFD